ncbi:hypothetical protein Tco_0640248 [Tanacetum coccineum]
MDDPNITMEEYIRLEEEKARKRAIVFNDTLTFEEALSCEPTVSSLNDEIDFRISFDESDDEDCTMSNMSEDIQYAGSDTRPPMLDRTDFESWQQRIRPQHEVHANENRIMMERFIQPTNDPLALVSNASVQQYPTQSSMSSQSLNQPLLVDNCQIDTGSTSTDNLIESLTNTLALLNQSFKAHLPQMNNQLRTPSNARNNATVQDGRVVVQDVRGRYNANNQGRPFQRNNAREVVGTGNVGGEQVTNFDDDVDDLALNVDHVFEVDQYDAFGSDVDEAPTTQTMFMDCPPDYSKENLLATFAPQRNLTPEQIFWSIDENDRKKAETSVPKPLSALTNTKDKQCAEIVKKTSIENENLIANCLSNQLLYDVEKSRCLDLEAEVSRVHNESKHISKLEREYLNLQLKYQHLQESFDNNKSQTSQEAPDFNSFFKIKNLEHQIQEKDNVIRDLKVLVSNVNDRSCEPYNANDVTDLLEQNERFRAEKKGASKTASDNEDDVLSKILGDSGNESVSPDKELVHSLPSMQRAASASGSNSEMDFDNDSTTPEELRQRAVEEKKKYKVLKAEGKPEEALRAFKRGKELERQAGTLEIELRKNRKKALSSSSVNKNKKIDNGKQPKQKDDLASELKDLGWSDHDLHDAEKKPVSMTLEGELSTLLKEVTQKIDKPEKSNVSIDRSEVIAIKKNALALKREGKLAEVCREAKEGTKTC